MIIRRSVLLNKNIIRQLKKFFVKSDLKDESWNYENESTANIYSDFLNFDGLQDTSSRSINLS